MAEANELDRQADEAAAEGEALQKEEDRIREAAEAQREADEAAERAKNPPEESTGLFG